MEKPKELPHARIPAQPKSSEEQEFSGSKSSSEHSCPQRQHIPRLPVTQGVWGRWWLGCGVRAGREPGTAVANASPNPTWLCQQTQTTYFYSTGALGGPPRAGHTWKSALQSLSTRVNGQHMSLPKASAVAL